MEKQDENTKQNFTDQIIGQVINTWTSRNAVVTAFFNKYPDDTYLSEVAKGRNRAIYLLGHLISANDGMLPLFGFGQKLFPDLDEFSTKADRSFESTLTIAELKSRWEQLNLALTERFNSLTANEWMSKHTEVSDEDFAKEPQRNKLNVLLGRTNHQSYHMGQLNLLTVKELVS